AIRERRQPIKGLIRSPPPRGDLVAVAGDAQVPDLVTVPRRPLPRARKAAQRQPAARASSDHVVRRDRRLHVRQRRHGRAQVQVPAARRGAPDEYQTRRGRRRAVPRRGLRGAAPVASGRRRAPRRQGAAAARGGAGDADAPDDVAPQGQAVDVRRRAVSERRPPRDAAGEPAQGAAARSGTAAAALPPARTAHEGRRRLLGPLPRPRPGRGAGLLLVLAHARGRHPVTSRPIPTASRPRRTRLATAQLNCILFP
ncbi:unnamed protein product, partial [Pelagomonas calceolata]